MALAVANGVGGGGHARPWGGKAEGRGGENQRARERQRGVWHLQGDVGKAAASRRWRARVGARRAHAPLPTGRRVKTVATTVGWARWAARRQAPGKVFSSLYHSYYVFYFL